MRKRKILFINPSCSTDFLNSSVVNAAMGKTCFFPSLSLMTIAALTPKDRFDVELFDEYLGKTVETWRRLFLFAQEIATRSSRRTSSERRTCSTPPSAPASSASFTVRPSGPSAPTRAAD